MAYQVLLVDDELPALRFIQSIIEKYAPDFQVTHTCPSGEKAYEYLQSHAVDVLITDIAMQRMNVIELAKLARRLQQDICRLSPAICRFPRRTSSDIMPIRTTALPSSDGAERTRASRTPCGRPR